MLLRKSYRLDPEVQSAEDLLHSRRNRGAGFGGRLRIGTLAIEDPFSSLASIKLAAELDSIQLEQLEDFLLVVSPESWKAASTS